MKNEKHTVIKANALIEGRKSFSLLEMKLLLSVISQIKREDKDFERYRVHIQDFKNLLNKQGLTYNKIRNTAKTLKSKNIELETETGHHQTSYFTDIFTYKQQGYMDCYISPFLKPYLLQLKREFTVYDIRNIINCKSVHSIRIYQLLKQYETIGQRNIKLKDLKTILGLDSDQYPRWANFRTRILETARKELKKYSDIYFEYETKRQGHMIHKVIFTIKKQRQRRLFDNEDFIRNDAVVGYQEDATQKIKQLEKDFEEGVSFKDFANEKEPK
jgi:plasmid replication initiation protein